MSSKKVGVSIPGLAGFNIEHVGTFPTVIPTETVLIHEYKIKKKILVVGFYLDRDGIPQGKVLLTIDKNDFD